VRAELEQLRGTATQLTQDVAAIRDASREADDNAFSAAEAVKEMDRRLGQIEPLRELSDTVEEKLTSLNALAEHVSQKVRALEAQKQVIDRASVETDRLNELVWGMDAQIAKLDGWLRQADRTEERLSRLDQLASELKAKLDVATSVGEDFRASFQELLTHADDLARKQTHLETLQAQLDQAREMSTQVAGDIQNFRSSQADLEILRGQVQEFHHAYSGAAQLADKLTADRAALEEFDNRVSSFRAGTPELEARLEAILGRMADIDQRMRDAEQLSDIVTGLEKQLGRVHEQSSFLDALEKRLDQLLEIASGVDDRLSSQLTRRADVDALGVRYDEIAAQAVDTERKVGALAGAQDQIKRLDTQVKGLEGRLAETTTRIEVLQRDEAALERHQARLVDAADASRTLAEEAAERIKAMYALVDQLTRTSAVSDRVVEALTQVQALQHESVARAESLEKSMSEFARRSDEIEQMLRVIAERNAFEATTGKIAAPGGVDEMEAQELMAAATAAEQKMPADVMLSKSTATDLLEGARLNLRTASEQKEMVDQLNGRLTNVQSLIQEAHSTLRVLNQERELLERIDQSIRQLRNPGDVSEGERETV
jgi:chromosome segregation ATPase